MALSRRSERSSLSRKCQILSSSQAQMRRLLQVLRVRQVVDHQAPRMIVVKTILTLNSLARTVPSSCSSYIVRLRTCQTWKTIRSVSSPLSSSIKSSFLPRISQRSEYMAKSSHKSRNFSIDDSVIVLRKIENWPV